MLEPAQITTLGAAFTAGLVTSLHCVGMCGPLVCLLGSPKSGTAMNQLVTGIYHMTRILSYTLIGAIAGAVGGLPTSWFHHSWAHYLPWVLVILLVLIALGVENYLPKPRWIMRWTTAAQKRLMGLPKPLLGAGMGALTPFLPCGPLYLVFGVALLSGSALSGAGMMMAFGLGTMPLLWLFQSQFVYWRTRIRPGILHFAQRTLALVAAGFVALRLLAMPTGEAMADTTPANPEEAVEQTAPQAPKCPLCPSHKNP